MKNLGKTIDRLISIDQGLEKSLKPIKNKWKRWPKRTMNYWAELLEVLNSDDLMEHPDRDKMSQVLNDAKKRKRPNYSFEVISMHDRIVGPLTGLLADKIRRLDLRSIKIGRDRAEANMTHNLKMQIDVARREQLLEIETKKIWVALRDEFKLWTKPGYYNIKVSTENNILYMVEQLPQPQLVGPGVIKMNPDMLKKFFDFMGMDPPPELFGGK